MATVASYRTLTLPPPLTSFSIYELTNERSCVGCSLRNRECVAAKREDCEDVFLFSAVFFNLGYPSKSTMHRFAQSTVAFWD